MVRINKKKYRVDFKAGYWITRQMYVHPILIAQMSQQIYNIFQPNGHLESLNTGDLE